MTDALATGNGRLARIEASGTSRFGPIDGRTNNEARGKR
jgi:hypothetical protein